MFGTLDVTKSQRFLLAIPVKNKRVSSCLHNLFDATFNNKAFVLENLERYEEALECLKQSTKIDPNYAEIWLRKGEILWNLQRFYDARDDFDQAIKIDPTSADAWYNKACTEVYLDLIDQGLEDLSKAIELRGEEIKKNAKEDKFLQNVRSDPRFTSMIK